MVKKVFALASVTALAGLIISTAAAGCSSTTTVAGDDTPDTSTGVKDSGNGRPDTSVVVADTGPGTCPTTDAIDTSDEPFTAPNAPVAGACTPADFAAIEAAIKANSSATTTDLENAVSAACKTCGFGPATEATWTPIVIGATVDGMTADIVNVGACEAVASGKAECGKAYAGWSDCLEQACTDCAASAQAACGQAAQATGAACDTQTQALATACGADVNTYLSACQNLPDTYCGTSCAGNYIFEPELAALCGKAPATDDGG